MLANNLIDPKKPPTSCAYLAQDVSGFFRAFTAAALAVACTPSA